MKVLFAAILLLLVVLNIGCFIKSKKYFNKAVENEGESNENFDHGMKYIKLSIVISFLICIVGATFVILNRMMG